MKMLNENENDDDENYDDNDDDGTDDDDDEDDEERGRQFVQLAPKLAPLLSSSQFLCFQRGL